jgi:hypothetical protein
MGKARQNFHCNFRAPDEEWFEVWLEFKKITKILGLDICFVVLSLCRVWLESQKEGVSTCQLKTATQIIFLTQTNTFNYNVKKPRRERFQLDCSKSLPKCTLCSRAFGAYIIVNARELDREFCFRDFPEIDHGFFRKLILRLRQKGEVITMKPRTLPEFYILPEWRDRYHTMSENNIVKPKFSGNAAEIEKQTGGYSVA